MKIYIPWKVRTTCYSVYQHSRSILSRARRIKNTGLNISFLCNYHQITGSTIAIACIANELADQHNVDAYIIPLSGYSRLLNLNVRQHFSSNTPTGNVVFVNIEQANAIIEQLIANNSVILTCHAFPTLLHSVPPDKLNRNLELATYIHFVSNTQRDEFIQYYPDINIEQKSFVIPNYTRKSTKSSKTDNIGIIGHLNRDIKNALKGIQLAQASDARQIQCWGSDTISGLDNSMAYPKLKINGWSDNLNVIHNSFDVLVSTSLSETFGLVVVEALSAGIPCVLSDIPVFRELFAECSGVVFLSGNDQQDIQSINALLKQASDLGPDITEFWETRFSNDAIKQMWLNKLRQLFHNT